MATEREQQDALLALLNSTPVVEGDPRDDLADPAARRSWQRAHGGTGSAAEGRALVEARDALQSVVRGSSPAASLTPLLAGVTSRPRATPEGVDWELDVPDDRRLAVDIVMAWSAVQRTMPSRLRPCANDECRLFLLDRSKTNKGRWCSMAVCGNRMKARRHYQRTREATADAAGGAAAREPAE
ncbi:CGNR zinc finger domain-containing protein [Actinacidiphila rubida]|uniref:Putative stress-induced transcription regulator n=1 Tax=Actinacidiphila rubida TaxID=310780 RepID=A0A1H8LJF7_9ACTN|nr:CGNR zinc finger domain-containing protein [Actinacidiphila rubida]SEO04916.1 Putative stress-induced transcription regulator [Actinacidiphila rubida]